MKKSDNASSDAAELSDQFWLDDLNNFTFRLTPVYLQVICGACWEIIYILNDKLQFRHICAAAFRVQSETTSLLYDGTWTSTVSPHDSTSVIGDVTTEAIPASDNRTALNSFYFYEVHVSAIPCQLTNIEPHVIRDGQYGYRKWWLLLLFSNYIYILFYSY